MKIEMITQENCYLKTKINVLELIVNQDLCYVRSCPTKIWVGMTLRQTRFLKL